MPLYKAGSQIGQESACLGPSFVERAPPKVNLTLAVLGRRPVDGYHELDSLVAFAHDVADIVSLDAVPRQAVGSSDREISAPVVVTGPFAESIIGENLLDVALRSIAARFPGLALGRVTLDKRLPIAAGIGGGSADAAALIRALMRANPQLNGAIDWHAFATQLGADVPVCLNLRAQRLQGLGDRLVPVPDLPQLHAVLANPLSSVPPDKTARVFRALAAPMVSADLIASAITDRSPTSPDLSTRERLIAHMRRIGNDLTLPARSVVPEIEAVLAALCDAPSCELAQMSGGGPTCFGIFPGPAEAERAVTHLRAGNPGWWVAASVLS